MLRKMTFVRSLLLLSILTAISGCKSVTIPDTEWCGDMGNDGASCYHTIAPDSRQVTKAAWDAERVGMLCTKAETFASWKNLIEKLCHVSKDCDYQTQKRLTAFFDRSEVVATSARPH